MTTLSVCGLRSLATNRTPIHLPQLHRSVRVTHSRSEGRLPPLSHRRPPLGGASNLRLRVFDNLHSATAPAECVQSVTTSGDLIARPDTVQAE